MTQAKRSAEVKICGIKEESTLLGMEGLPVDYVGFVFAKSRRQLSPEQAGKLARVAKRIPMADGKSPKTVGVFVNPTIGQLDEAMAEAKLDVIQLHGDESPDFCKEAGARYGAEIWRALPVRAEGSEGTERLAEFEGSVAAILLDTVGGGTGQTFRWDIIPAYREEAERLGLKLFIAGGLTPENAGELVEDYCPQGVDISSGVETDGTKDIGKITTFARRVKSQ